MPVKTDERIYRSMDVMEPVASPDGGEGPSYRVRGYATTFDDPYELYSGVYELVARGSIDANTDMSDVIMQYDHAGRVLARTSNGTLVLKVDDHGLHVDADLSKSSNARSMSEEISAGLITKMSFAFTVDDEEWDERTSTRTIKHIKKIYDVSAVSMPANDATEISARSFADGVIGARRDGEIAAARAKAKLRLLGAAK